MTAKQELLAGMGKQHEKALEAFIGTLGGIRQHLAELTEFADEHLGYNPDEIHWGHVGTANHYLETLKELTDFAFNRGEYAREEQS